ncbi:MAG TPA: DUF3500 domain-containing protein [Armatimonadaceae bacterium]|nr:DUF3500 domain-containing protein [Armatimonadaceae bacterium]
MHTRRTLAVYAAAAGSLLTATLLVAVAPGPARVLPSAHAAHLLQRAADRPHDAAQAFVRALRPEQRAKAVLPFDDEERINWHFVPRARKGIALHDLTPEQQKGALRLLAACLSEQGYRKAEAVRALETVLQEIENDPSGRYRNPTHYYVTLFGEPGAKGVWGWRYEGHHLSFNFTVRDGTIVASSPQFLGANPAKVLQGVKAGTRTLPEEEDLGRALARSLTPVQREKGLKLTDVPGDILSGASREAKSLPAAGVAYRDLDATQKGMLLELIRTHAGVQSKAVAEARVAAIRKAGMDDVAFLWIGETEPGKRHYYRIQGATFLVEYDNTQNRANHVHAVWRDFRGDFGRDALAEHYRAFSPDTLAGRSHGHDGGAHEHPHGPGGHTHEAE